MKKIIVIFVLIISLLLLGGGSLIWWDSDQISRASMKTNMMFLASPILSDEDLVEWVTTYHGEAPGHQVMVTFCHWGISNRPEFIKLLGYMESSDLQRVAWALYDSGNSNRFISEFSDSDNEKIKEITDEIRRIGQRGSS